MTDGLLLVGHGSPDRRHATALARLSAAVQTGQAGPVALAFLEHDAPDPAVAAADLMARGAHRICIVPLLLAAGFHDRSDIPAATAAAAMTGLPTVTATALGPHPLLINACRERLATLDGSAAPVVVAHGGAAGSASHKLAEKLADGLGARCAASSDELPDVLRDVHPTTVLFRLLLADGVLGDRLTAAATAVGIRTVGGLADAPATAHLVALRAAEALAVPGSHSAPTAARTAR